VLSTDPDAGAEVVPGTVVDYVVSAGPEPTPTPEPTPAPVAVPDLRGIAEEDAVNQLLDLGLQPGERTESFDADVPSGAVISTEPAADAELAPGTAVDYVVSLGVEPTPTPEPTPAPVAVPDLPGVAEEDAVNQLLDLGLQPGERTESFDADVPTGSIISTDPDAGAEVVPGTAVDYVVSLGVEPTPTPEPTPAPVAVPDLRGVTEEDAVNQLLDLGLQPGERTDTFDTDVAAGAVLSTDPDAGAEVVPGTVVDYVVSAGPEPTPTPEPTPAPLAVPDLRGIAEEDAVNQLLDLGLQPGERSERFHESVAAGSIIRTDPEAGAEVTPGTAVAYVVSLGVEPTPSPEPTPAPVAVPDLRGVAEEDAVNQLLEQGLQPGERTESFDAEVAAGAVLSTEPAAGTEVAVGTIVAYVVSLGADATPAPIVIPDLRGVAEEDALNQLLDLGLQPGTRRERFHASVPIGGLLRTDPASGTEVAAGTVVDYFVSKGPEPIAEPTPGQVEVPNVRGSSPEDAVAALLDANLTPGERRNRYHDSVTRGEVIRTDPAAGELVEAGTAVDYFVSRGPQPEATSEPTPEPTEAPTPEPTESSSSAQATIDEIAGQVETIRELDAKDDVPYREISRKRFRQEVEAQFDEENPARRVASEEAFLTRLGLIPEGMDLREALLDLYESQVAAFYDPKTGTMTVIGDQGEFGAADRLFISHEYDHALQDQHWHLDEVMDLKPSQGDRALARLSLIEGDATNVMYQWALENLGPDDISELSNDVSSMDQTLLNDMPAILRRQLEMPYVEGQAFVAALRQAGGWDAVNDAWERLPASTEQILHPDRYPSDRPANIELPDIQAAMGDGWTLRYTMTLGELGMRVLLANGGSESDIAPAAEGWGGDRLMMVDGPGDTWVIVWQTAWDSADDAQEFVDTASLDSVRGVHAVLPGSDLTGKQDAPVLVLLASDDATLGAVEDALGVSEVVLQ
jgi:beta-lactam-binding protein with PASTA domain